jgi:hypothetical protein
MMTRPIRQIAVFAATAGAVLIGGAGIASAAPGHATVAASDCGGTVYAAPAAHWGPVSTSNCGYFGSPGAKLTITWYENPADISPDVCVQAYSYSEKQWVSVGCGTSGEGTIPWGNVDATPEVRAESAGVGQGISWFQE